MKYVYVYHSAEVIDTFVFNQSHCVPVVRPLMDHNNKHSAYHQVHCRTRTIISHFFKKPGIAQKIDACANGWKKRKASVSVPSVMK